MIVSLCPFLVISCYDIKPLIGSSLLVRVTFCCCKTLSTCVDAFDLLEWHALLGEHASP